MALIYKEYGTKIEITETEKEVSRARRIFATKARTDVYGARRFDNIRRSKKIFVRRVLSALEEFGSPLLVTLTFNGSASDARYASDSLGRFQRRLQAFFDTAESVFVPELSPRGRIHFHGLVFGVPLQYGDIRKGGRVVSYGKERANRHFAQLWGEGFVDVQQTDGSGRLGNYIAKYITKCGGEPLFNAHRLIRVSRGFPKEIVVRDDFAVILKKKYAKSKPDYYWEGYSPFLGRITKTYYTKKSIL